MKKLLMLGGSYTQVSAIKKAREMGHYVITCDYLEDNPGHQYAHEYYNVSTTDKEAVLRLAESLKIDGIVCYASDPAAPTAAYVAEKMGLPTHPYKSVEILSNKDLFREFQKENNFNVPRAKSFHSLEDAIKDFHNFKMPVMIKPVDSSGSKGVSKIESIELLEEKVENALSFSRAKRFIIEEYIENKGYHIGGDGFSVDGKLVFRSFSDEHFQLITSSNPFVPISSTWPCTMDNHIQNKIHDEIQRVLNHLNMKTGAFNFDIRVDAEENVYLIEIGARNGGDWMPEAIKHVTGIDLIEFTINAALGENCSELKLTNPRGYWATHIINSKKCGIFKYINFEDKIKKNIVEYEFLAKPGDKINPLSGAHDKLGIMILKFSSIEEMLEKIDNIDKYIHVIVEEN